MKQASSLSILSSLISGNINDVSHYPNICGTQSYHYEDDNATPGTVKFTDISLTLCGTPTQVMVTQYPCHIQQYKEHARMILLTLA